MSCAEFQAKFPAAPRVLPGVWGQNSRIPGEIPGDAWSFAWILSTLAPSPRTPPKTQRATSFEVTRQLVLYSMLPVLHVLEMELFGQVLDVFF